MKYSEIADRAERMRHTVARISDKLRIEERKKVLSEETAIPCPSCASGTLVVRIGPYSKFMGCSNFPNCHYTQGYKEELL